MIELVAGSKANIEHSLNVGEKPFPFGGEKGGLSTGASKLCMQRVASEGGGGEGSLYTAEKKADEQEREREFTWEKKSVAEKSGYMLRGSKEGIVTVWVCYVC